MVGAEGGVGDVGGAVGLGCAEVLSNQLLPIELPLLHIQINMLRPGILPLPHILHINLPGHHLRRNLPVIQTLHINPPLLVLGQRSVDLPLLAQRLPPFLQLLNQRLLFFRLLIVRNPLFMHIFERHIRDARPLLRLRPKMRRGARLEAGNRRFEARVGAVVAVGVLFLRFCLVWVSNLRVGIGVFADAVFGGLELVGGDRGAGGLGVGRADRFSGLLLLLEAVAFKVSNPAPLELLLEHPVNIRILLAESDFPLLIVLLRLVLMRHVHYFLGLVLKVLVDPWALLHLFHAGLASVDRGVVLLVHIPFHS